MKHDRRPGPKPVRQPFARQAQPVERILERARSAAPAAHASDPAAQDAHLMRKLRELEDPASRD
jgi:hypothetical protein